MFVFRRAAGSKLHETKTNYLSIMAINTIVEEPNLTMPVTTANITEISTRGRVNKFYADCPFPDTGIYRDKNLP
jgi:hypothetical protein